MKILFIFLLLIISCSDEKFNNKENQGIQAFILYHKNEKTMDLSLQPWPEPWDCDYFWIINGNIVRQDKGKAVYGLNSVKLVLVDAFGDTTISDSISFPVLKVNLLSPVDSFSINSPLSRSSFKYEVQGEDELERIWSHVYVSKDTNSLWNEENKVNTTFIALTPPYFWGIKIITEYDDGTFFSEARWIQAKN